MGMLYLPRELEERLRPWMEKPEVLIIKGPRQAGKTTLLKHLREVYGGTYINVELPHVQRRIVENPLSLAEMEGPLYLDEIGSCTGCGKAIKVLYDEKRVKMVVSGSGAFEMKENVGGYLVGRALYFELFPLSFREFLLWKRPSLYEEYLPYHRGLWAFLEGKGKPEEPLVELREAVEAYMAWGGYPQVVLREEKEMLLSNIITTAIEKDVFFFFDIKDRAAFSHLMVELAHRTGQLLHYSELGLPYRKAERYVSILEAEYFVETVPPFYNNPRTELRKTRKLYFHDLGILRLLSEGRVGQGALVENFVFIQLRRRAGKIHYWRTEGKAEVDFVLKGKEGPIPIEVKASPTPALPKALRSFIKAYNPPRALILTGGLYREEHVGETEVLFYPYWFL